ncbi:hypothetical protein BRYFOR_05358 [Marvinbryantia formatexigens DSM 14469]|uniref:Uncharacterized protein n=1 Tax=Marvinbryantia formatexigens DSM 14469 TaxID=478749 RepID=C6L9R8_9FIRM|nr:hypothetical protein BRYFOR_05358 [Marvinbryantia formatexigens DSM 14469]
MHADAGAGGFIGRKPATDMERSGMEVSTAWEVQRGRGPRPTWSGSGMEVSTAWEVQKGRGPRPTWSEAEWR